MDLVVISCSVLFSVVICVECSELVDLVFMYNDIDRKRVMIAASDAIKAAIGNMLDLMCSQYDFDGVLRMFRSVSVKFS